MIRQKTGSLGGLIYVPYISREKTLKSFLSETTGPILMLFGRNISLVPSTKIAQAIAFRQKHDWQGVALIFPIYLYRKFEKSSYH